MNGDELDRRVVELLMRTARRALPSHEAMAALGLTPAQARALGMIWRSDEPLRMTVLAQHLHVVPRAVTPLVDALEDGGLVRRRTDPDNRRSTLLEITERGVEVSLQVQQVRGQAVTELLEPLSTAQRRTLLTLLETIGGGTDDEGGPDAMAARLRSARDCGQVPKEMSVQVSTGAAKGARGRA